MKKIILPFLLLLTFELTAQNKDEKLILGILDQQTQAWNDGNLEKFMVGYWENDSLMYVGKGGVTYGYRQTLENYKKNYGTTDKMGQLKFTILHVNKLSSEVYQVVGKWFLKRSVGDVGGHFTLIFRKMKGEWKIVSDHSS
jgi:ketosteroid isomerase-like protein